MDSDPRLRKNKPSLFLRLVSWLNSHLSSYILSKTGEDPRFTPKEIQNALSYTENSEKGKSESDVTKENETAALSAEIIGNAFEFKGLTVSDVMTHRVKTVAVNKNSTLDWLVYLALSEGFSRIPVYENTIDNIVGVIIVKDLLSLVNTDIHQGINEKNRTKESLSSEISKENRKLQPPAGRKEFSISGFIRKITKIPETCPLSSAWKTLIAQKEVIAAVIDEYGGTAGIVTLEDIIESVMGDVQDEYDEEAPDIKLLSTKDSGTGDGETRHEICYELSGDADPEEVLELFGIEPPDDFDFDTVSGFVTDLLGYIPEKDGGNKTVNYNGIRFTVVEVAENRIERIIADNSVD